VSDPAQWQNFADVWPFECRADYLAAHTVFSAMPRHRQEQASAAARGFIAYRSAHPLRSGNDPWLADAAAFLRSRLIFVVGLSFAEAGR
jgi:hypothetical protein